MYTIQLIKSSCYGSKVHRKLMTVKRNCQSLINLEIEK